MGKEKKDTTKLIKQLRRKILEKLKEVVPRSQDIMGENVVDDLVQLSSHRSIRLPQHAQCNMQFNSTSEVQHTIQHHPRSATKTQFNLFNGKCPKKMAERLVNDVVATILVFDNMVKQLALLYIQLEARPDIQEKMVRSHHTAQGRKW